MKLYCVFSTLTSDNRYVDYKDSGNGVPVEGDSVLVKGGAGVANDRILTPRGMATMVTEAQIELLRRNTVFAMHEVNGFVAIEAVDRPPGETDVENAATAMANRDASAPLVPEDFTANGQQAPLVGETKPKPAAKATK